jgi:prevent-host-death family protein
MEYLKFTELRNKSKEYFDRVEDGGSYIVIRKGKPIAKITPFYQAGHGWKRETVKIKLKNGPDSGRYIADERDEKINNQ